MKSNSIGIRRIFQDGALVLIPANKHVAVFLPAIDKHAVKKNHVCEAKETALSITHSKQNLVFEVPPVTFE